MSNKFVHSEIAKNSNKLTRQQVKTLHGQLKVGNVDGAYKGLQKILNRRAVVQ